MALPRLLTAVPSAWPVRLEIAKAIQMLAAEVANSEERRRQRELEAVRRDFDLAMEELHEICRDLVKAGFRPDQPRWRRGSGRRSGRWEALG